MPGQRLTKAAIEDEEQTLGAQLRRLAETSKDREGLQLTGLEILVFVASKIVVPIFCSIVSRALYEKYKDMQTNSMAAAARNEIAASAGARREPVDEKIVVAEIAAAAVKEGIPKARAVVLVSETYQRIVGQYGS